ncbi:hypothetical protein T484DRAFT_2413052 [Baffinella frigidus]|nr:hypothetical protein T484DRAFT_2413052 [Cryptophyta sp. CCMP2293]
MAWVRQYPFAKCTGGPITVDNLPGLGSDVCKSATFDTNDFKELTFDSAQVTLTTPNSRMSVQRTGAAVNPTFSLLTAKGKKTGAGSSNCMTVTMISNMALASTDQNKVTSLTIHGLTGSSTASTDTLPLFLDDMCATTLTAEPATGVRVNAGVSVDGTTAAARLLQSDLLVSPASIKKAWQAVWQKDDGTVVFEIGEGRSISAGQVVVFSFSLVNGPDFQDSRAISLTANGYYCKTNLCLSTNTQAVSIPATAFHSSSKMLQIKAPTFETAVISQSTSDPEQEAIITVTLKANKALTSASSSITIEGICGTISNQDVAISVVGSTPATTFNTIGEWDETTKKLKITVGSTGLSADVEYVFSYTWKLVKNENAACPIKITASGTDTFASAVMTNSAGSAG